MKFYNFLYIIILLLLCNITLYANETDLNSSNWFLGTSAGIGSIQIENESIEYHLGKGSEQNIGLFLNIVAGYSFSSSQLGLECSHIYQSGQNSLSGIGDYTIDLNMVNISTTYRYFPFTKYFFVKGGFGYTILHYNEVLDSTTIRDEANGAYQALAGCGIDFPVSKKSHIVLNFDYSMQLYIDDEAPYNTDYYALYLSYYWQF